MILSTLNKIVFLYRRNRGFVVTILPEMYTRQNLFSSTLLSVVIFSKTEQEMHKLLT